MTSVSVFRVEDDENEAGSSPRVLIKTRQIFEHAVSQIHRGGGSLELFKRDSESQKGSWKFLLMIRIR